MADSRSKRPRLSPTKVPDASSSDAKATHAGDDSAEHKVCRRILGARVNEQGKQYLLLWKGLPLDDASWEPEDHPAATPELKKQYLDSLSGDRLPSVLSKPGPAKMDVVIPRGQPIVGKEYAHCMNPDPVCHCKDTDPALPRFGSVPMGSVRPLPTALPFSRAQQRCIIGCPDCPYFGGDDLALSPGDAYHRLHGRLCKLCSELLKRHRRCPFCFKSFCWCAVSSAIFSTPSIAELHAFFPTDRLSWQCADVVSTMNRFRYRLCTVLQPVRVGPPRTSIEFDISSAQLFVFCFAHVTPSTAVELSISDDPRDFKVTVAYDNAQHLDRVFGPDWSHVLYDARRSVQQNILVATRCRIASNDNLVFVLHGLTSDTGHVCWKVTAHFSRSTRMVEMKLTRPAGAGTDT